MSILSTIADAVTSQIRLAESIIAQIQTTKTALEKIETPNDTVTHMIAILTFIIENPTLNHFFPNMTEELSEHFNAIDDIEGSSAPYITDRQTRDASEILLNNINKIYNGWLQNTLTMSGVNKDFEKYLSVIRVRIDLYDKFENKTDSESLSKFISTHDFDNERFSSFFQDFVKKLEDYAQTHRIDDFDEFKLFFLSLFERKDQTVANFIEKWQAAYRFYITSNLKGNRSCLLFLNEALLEIAFSAKKKETETPNQPSITFQDDYSNNTGETIKIINPNDIVEDVSIYFDDKIISIISAIFSDPKITNYDQLKGKIEDKSLRINKMKWKIELINIIENFIKNKNISLYHNDLFDFCTKNILVSNLFIQTKNIADNINMGEYLKKHDNIFIYYLWRIICFFHQLFNSNETFSNLQLLELESDNAIENTLIQDDDAGNFFENIIEADFARTSLKQKSFINSITDKEEKGKLAKVATQAFVEALDDFKDKPINEAIRDVILSLLYITNSARQNAGWELYTSTLLDTLLFPPVVQTPAPGAQSVPTTTPRLPPSSEIYDPTFLPYLGQVYGFVATQLHQAYLKSSQYMMSAWHFGPQQLIQQVAPVIMLPKMANVLPRM